MNDFDAGQRAIVLQQPCIERIGAAQGTDIKHRVGDIGRRHIDPLTGGQRHVVDHELARRRRAVSVPQLQSLVADAVRIQDRHQAR